ncbi:MAG: GIY-YIG nuclease family protein [Acidobacteria bacterium]|nr:GIY-YIG nuclease family protein [Acidobacteriota bacterium]
MSRKTVPYSRQGITELPNDKPVVYKILTPSGNNNYTGIAKRGRVQERIAEHLPGGKDAVPGSKVVIEQVTSIAEAREKEQRIIARSQPKYNEQGK